MAQKPVCIGLVFIQGYAFYRGVLRGIRQYVETKPQWLFTSVAPESHRVPGPIRPDGIIAAVNTKWLVRSLSSWRRPVVNVSAIFPGLRFPRVGVDNVQVGRLAAAHFLDRGLRQFGFVGPTDYLFSIERREAFCEALRQAGHTVAYCKGARYLPYDPFVPQGKLDPSVVRWLRELPKPVGIFVPNDIYGVQIAEACRSAGLRVPEDVALLGVDNDDLYCEMTRPPLSSIMVPAEKVGYEAAALLDRLLAGEKPPREPILLPPTGVATRRSSEVLAIDDKEVVTAVRFIREHAHLPLRVADVLPQVSVGRRTLERHCHLALGWGIGEEIRRAHLERACRLLAATDLPLKVLAKQAGFSDFRLMTAAFHKELGMTPSAYRRQMRSPAGEAGP
jgi:LacI family transcriptional regulator